MLRMFRQARCVERWPFDGRNPQAFSSLLTGPSLPGDVSQLLWVNLIWCCQPFFLNFTLSVFWKSINQFVMEQMFFISMILPFPSRTTLINLSLVTFKLALHFSLNGAHQSIKCWQESGKEAIWFIGADILLTLLNLYLTCWANPSSRWLTKEKNTAE